MRLTASTVLVSLCLCLSTSSAAAGEKANGAANKPNVVVILTDDQDLRLDSLDYMQGVKTHLTDQGTYYEHHFATVALCCPARATLWTGKAAHNTNVTDVVYPWGGYQKFTELGWHTKWLPVWLQEAGYKTYFIGKFLNGHSTTTYDDPFPQGLDGNDFLLEPGTYNYLDPILQHDNDTWKEYPGNYSTDLISNVSMARLDEVAQAGAPFFIAINPIGPHFNTNGTNPPLIEPPIPADRHKDLFPDNQVPRVANFNPDSPSGASWVKQLEKLNQSNVDYIDEWYRLRLRTLQSVDDLVNATIDRLQSHGLLDNTYIIYSSDNGYHMGNHRQQPGKRCPYEEDINVPLIIRGPGVPKGQTLDVVTSHMDIVPTILGWTGGSAPDGFELDGKAIPTTAPAGASSQPWEHAQIEHWGPPTPEGAFAPVTADSGINTYKALRVVGQNYSLYYSVWCNGDHEVYDMTTDSVQMNNLYNSTDHDILGVNMTALQSRLDAMLLVLKTCVGETCSKPWTALHPDGKVQCLVDALDSKYDEFYEVQQNKVAYQACDRGYFIEQEMPIKYFAYGDAQMNARADAYYNWPMFLD